MKVIDIKKIHDGKFIKNYLLTYLNKEDKEKKYEIVSHKELSSVEDLGKSSSGCVIVAVRDNHLLLLKEFRVPVNKYVYNLCAGRIENGETLEDCVRRELYEETGLKLKGIIKILPAAYASVSISDISNTLVFVNVEGEISDHTSDNEEIAARFYSREEVMNLVMNEPFSSRAQSVAYFFATGSEFK